MKGCDEGHTTKLNESLKLCGIIGHHIDYLPGTSAGPSGGTHVETLFVEESGYGRSNEDGHVLEDHLGSRLENRGEEWE